MSELATIEEQQAAASEGPNTDLTAEEIDAELNALQWGSEWNAVNAGIVEESKNLARVKILGKLHRAGGLQVPVEDIRREALVYAERLQLLRSARIHLQGMAENGHHELLPMPSGISIGAPGRQG